MRIGRVLRAANWKYAVGEVLLIAVGVLIALAASDWQSERVARRAEIEVLRGLNDSLSTDLASIEGSLQRFQRIEARLDLLTSHLREGVPYDESFDGLFGTVYGFASLRLNTARYESLKSTGLGLISDDELRSQLALVYEQAYPTMLATTELEQDLVLEVLRPYFLKNFRDLRFNQSATPIESDAVLSDHEFHNLVDYRLQAVRQSHMPTLRRGAGDIRILIDGIQVVLVD